MSGKTTLRTQVAQLIGRIEPELTGDMAARAHAIVERLDEPLRVAIAGRVKAGKSTLLNALVGERLAPTDAGECTKVVTWYRHGIQYDVQAVLDDGSARPLPFERQRDQLITDVGDLPIERVDRIEVTWPSARLRRYTLIDTPGLEGHDPARAERTRKLLGLDQGRSEVDAVVYLMRHAHRLDVDFLEAFTDRSLAHPSPVNAIAVLARADEIGAARLDALEAAHAVAARYATDPRIRNLCATVVAVAGLIAEAGRTLVESEAHTMRALAGLPDDEIQAMLLSVDRFADPMRSPIDDGVRRALLIRLGLFGARFGIDLLRRHDTSASDLARALVDASGIDRLAGLLDDHFGRRAHLLTSRSALGSLKALVAELPRSATTHGVEAEVEQLEAGSPELGELRLLHLAISGAAGFDEDDSREMNRLLADESPGWRVGLTEPADPADVVAVIVDRLEYWRRRAAYPLASTDRREACELVATEYERLHAEVTAAAHE